MRVMLFIVLIVCFQWHSTSCTKQYDDEGFDALKGDYCGDRHYTSKSGGNMYSSTEFITITVDSISPSLLRVKNHTFLHYGDSLANSTDSILEYHYYFGLHSGHAYLNKNTRSLIWKTYSGFSADEFQQYTGVYQYKD